MQELTNKWRRVMVDNDRMIIHLGCGDKRGKKKCLFLDRDGVIIKERHYIKNKMDVEIETGAIELMMSAKENNYLVIIVTNQSGIGRGFFNWNDYEDVTVRMLELIGLEVINAIYANSYTPESDKDASSWRKPGIGMLTTAVKDYDIELKKSLLVGDRNSDINSGYRAGVEYLVHVKTGHGEQELKSISESFSLSKTDLIKKQRDDRRSILSLNTLKDPQLNELIKYI